MKQKKTAAIYNRWLFTLGGGEQVTFAYAEGLRDMGYTTTLLTHQDVDFKAAEKKMNVNLKNIKVKYLPLMQPQKLSSYSEQYDLFINTSYLDYFPNRSKKGILSVFFPSEVYVSPIEFLKRKFIVPSFRSFFIYPVQYQGFSHDKFSQGKIFKWLDTHSVIHFSEGIFHELSIELHFPTFSFATIEAFQFYINEKRVAPQMHEHKHSKNGVVISFSSSEPIRVFSMKKPKKTTDVALIALTIPHFRYFVYNLFKKYFPILEMRLHGGPGITPLSDLQSYQKIVTISHFCQYWIKQYWGLPSVIVYPPVNTESFVPAKKKKKWITHIGRFFVTGHSKKQLDLVRVFKELYSQESMQDWELHFVGSVHDGKQHQSYFDACVEEAKGFPIYFHVSPPFSELKYILEHTKIYWHATGLDENEKKNPVLMEHFGITTVEAMAAGCVPVVINKGGQPEIITKLSGFIWNTREELKKNTLLLVKNDSIRAQMMKLAVLRSKQFDRNSFRRRFEAVVNQL